MRAFVSTIAMLTVAACATQSDSPITFVDQPMDYLAPPGAGQLTITGPSEVEIGEDVTWQVTGPDLPVGVRVSLGWGGQEVTNGRCLHQLLIGGWLCLDIGSPLQRARTVTTIEHPNYPGQGLATFDFTVPGTPRSHIFLQAISVDGLNSATTPAHRVDILRPGPPQSCQCPAGFTPRPADDGCVRLTETAPTVSSTTYGVCAITPSTAYGWKGGELPGGTRLTGEFFRDPVQANNHRLSRVGVWACTGSPNQEWIGFSECVDLPQPGLYMLGIAGDNNVRLKADAVTIYENIDTTQAPFNSWWLVPVVLESGAHNIELEGRNQGGPAGFGAEIYGPFPANTPLDDASLANLDYENNLVWSSETAADDFTLGQNSGMTCPAGEALSVCGPAPVCVLEETTDCL